MTKMIDVQNRVVAVTGDIKDIVLIDVWTMEILGSLAMNSLVI